MKKTAPFGLLAIALALTACSDTTDETSPEPTSVETETATPEPTETESSEEPEPSEPGNTVPGEQVASPVEFDVTVQLPPMPESPVVVTWKSPGESLHVYTVGSGTRGCYAVPTEAWTDGDTMEITFDPADAGATCTDDLVQYGWEFTFSEPFEVTDTMRVTLTNVLGQGHTLHAELPPEPTAPLG